MLTKGRRGCLHFLNPVGLCRSGGGNEGCQHGSDLYDALHVFLPSHKMWAV